ncbi:unnamed protein product [Amoebophrya sp. A120]|nr:unnamed protein product [Amoebophrya sp. A120]|eukprot:GSA120T00003747001.1
MWRRQGRPLRQDGGSRCRSSAALESRIASRKRFRSAYAGALFWGSSPPRSPVARRSKRQVETVRTPCSLFVLKMLRALRVYVEYPSRLSVRFARAYTFDFYYIQALALTSFHCICRHFCTFPRASHMRCVLLYICTLALFSLEHRTADGKMDTHTRACVFCA